MISLIQNILASIHISVMWIFKCSALTFRAPSVREESKRPLDIIISIRTLSPFNLFFELSYCLGAIKNGRSVVIMSDRYSRFYSHEYYTNSSSLFYRFCYIAVNYVVWSILYFGIFVSRCKYVNFIDVSDLRYSPVKTPDLANDHVLSSLGRFYKSVDCAEILRSKPEFTENCLKFSNNIIISNHISAYLSESAKINVLDRVIFSHGYYSIWGPIRDACEEHNFPYACYCQDGFIDDGICVSTKSVAAQRDDEGRFDHFFVNLSQEKIVEIEKIVDDTANRRSKRNGKDFWWAPSKNEPISADLRGWLSKEKARGQSVIGMFPNLVWDNASAFKSSNEIYHNLYDWLKDSVAIAQKYEGLSFVTRGHPVEATQHASSESAVELLRGALAEVPESVQRRFYLIEDASTDSYFLSRQVDAIYLFNGTLGLEMMYLNKPVIWASNSIMAQRCKWLVPRTRCELIAMLSNVAAVDFSDSSDSELRQRIVAYYFFCFYLHSDSFLGTNKSIKYRGDIHIDGHEIFAKVQAQLAPRKL